jgi:uncharacterized repeat protein (TIGR03803 family)
LPSANCTATERLSCLAIICLFCVTAAIAAPAQQLIPLAQFNGSNGSVPQAPLIRGRDGNFYGTTAYDGGTDGYGSGTVFQMSPQYPYTPTPFYVFCSQPNCADGANPAAGLVQGSDGNFYGTTYNGGAYDYGAVFKISARGEFIWSYSFCQQNNCPDGYHPQSTLVQATDGNFYGTTSVGGENDGGTIFKVTPSGALTTLHSFGSERNDGFFPVSGLVQGRDGNLYGTTPLGGEHDDGVVYTITPGGTGTPTTLYAFCSQPNCGDGESPNAALLQGNDGNFYGTTFETVFKITPGGALSTLYTFCTQPNCADGSNPVGALVQGYDGNLYGTMEDGGDNGYGTIFSVSPSGAFTPLHSFDLTDGAYPYAGLYLASNGYFYGTTSRGGNLFFDDCTNIGCGTVFSFAAADLQDYGVSGGNATDKCSPGQCSGGTLGSMVVLGSRQFILSNDHVFGLPISPTENSAPMGAPITRPGLNVNGCTAGQIVGNLAYAQTLNTGVDAAIATANPGAFSPVGKIAGIGIPAGETEVARVGMPVAKNGATTGLTCGVVMCTDMRVTVPYEHCGTYLSVTFDNQIAVQSRGSPFSCEGDSGSLIVDSNSSQPVALLIGGAGGCTSGHISIGNPIDTVLQELGGVSFLANPTHAVAGCSTLGGGGINPDSAAHPMPEPERQRAMQAKQANARRLMENPAVMGVGSGSQEDDPSQAALIILVRKGVSAEFIPDEIDGVGTRIIYTEPFVAGSCPADAQPEEAEFGASSAAPAAAANYAYDHSMMPKGLVVPSFDGSIDAYADGLRQLIMDISGYFAP